MSSDEKKQGPTSIKLPAVFKKSLLAATFLLTFILGVLITRSFYHRTQAVESENATVLLERIRSVAKLVTVEGYFSEIYDYKDYYGYDLGFLRKKALIRVKAKVSVGYDLEKMKLEAFPEEKTIVVSGIPPGEIISIEHDLDYYDVQEGIFNSFSPEDYNKLNASAKEFIRKKALESDLFKTAAEQRNVLLESMRFMAESTGWKLRIEETPIPPSPEGFDN